MRLWQAYLTEEHEMGGHVPPSRSNLLEFARLFDAYVTGTLRGGCLIAEDRAGAQIGVILGGSEFPSAISFETDLGDVGRIWGVYVVPEERRSGVCWELQDRAFRMAQEIGYDHVVSWLVPGLEPATRSAEGWGLLKDQTMIVYPIGRGQPAHAHRERG
jgi:hypothetical protein